MWYWTYRNAKQLLQLSFIINLIFIPQVYCFIFLTCVFCFLSLLLCLKPGDVVLVLASPMVDKWQHFHSERSITICLSIWVFFFFSDFFCVWKFSMWFSSWRAKLLNFLWAIDERVCCIVLYLILGLLSLQYQ